MLDYLHLEAATNPRRPAEEDEDEQKWQIVAQHFVQDDTQIHIIKVI